MGGKEEAVCASRVGTCVLDLVVPEGEGTLGAIRRWLGVFGDDLGGSYWEFL